MNHCDQCGEYVEYRPAWAKPQWIHTRTGSAHCVTCSVNGVAVSWAEETAEPCFTPGCTANEEEA